jgi:hypothetical protein
MSHTQMAVLELKVRTAQGMASRENSVWWQCSESVLTRKVASESIGPSREKKLNKKYRDRLLIQRSESLEGN